MTEARLTKDVIAYLKALRQSGRAVWWLKLHGGPMQRAGVPDLLVVLDGRLFAVELKRPGNEPTKLQYNELDSIERAGGVAEWVTTLDEFKELVK